MNRAVRGVNFSSLHRSNHNRVNSDCEAVGIPQTNWFEPALAALQSGQLAELGLTLCGDTGSVTLTVTRADLRKFWRRRVLASLFIE